MCCRRPSVLPPVIINRFTQQPLRLKPKEVVRMQKDFDQAAGSNKLMEIQQFRENMGILSVGTTQAFADRLFFSFDLDGDGVICLWDFLEFMDILTHGDFMQKAGLSFRLIAIHRQPIVYKQEFQQFLRDFLQCWSTITNFFLTKEMDMRLQHYVDSLFVRILRDTGCSYLTFEYFLQVLCLRNEFISALDYITQGIGSDEEGSPEDYQRIVTSLEKYLTILQQRQGYYPATYTAQQIRNLISANHTVGQAKVPFTPPAINRRFNSSYMAQMQNPSQGRVIFFGDNDWNLALNMMIGIQSAVRSAAFINKMEDDAHKEYYFSLVPRRFGAQNSPKICDFIDYAPITFRKIRELFGVEDQDYLKSLGPDRLLASLVLGEISSMTSMISQGKSGAIFYTSSDGQYLLKSIKHRQFVHLRMMLRSYYAYIVQYPQTLLTRFLGLYQIRQKKGCCSIRKNYFVVMSNVFNIDERISDKYDIKGSTYKRFVGPEDTHSTKRDLNFLERGPIYIPLNQRQALLTQLYYDTQFLQYFDTNDYSLLVGIIKPGSLKQQLNMIPVRLLVQAEENALKDKTKPKIYQSRIQNGERYVFGLIDTLTHFGKLRTIESAYKRCMYGNQVSALPPEMYSARMIDFVARHVLQ